MSSPAQTQEWLKNRLTELEHVLRDMGENFAGFAAAAEDLCLRLDEGRFRLAVLGQFKRGKSTLLNALLREPLLPSGILPVTAIPTVLRYGPHRRVRISFLDGHSEEYEGSPEHLHAILMRYVSEQENPANRFGVARVDVEHPAALLAQCVEIMDTPGIGSTMLHNTRAAREVLPVCDGAIVVLSPDPPVTEVEVQFLRAVREAAAWVIVVLTKADLLEPSERQPLLTFLMKVLRENAGFSGQERIFLVSARQALEVAGGESPPRPVEGGVAELESFLTAFLLTEKRAALHDAIRRKGARLIRETIFSLDLQRKIIELPREDLARRTERFEAHLAKIDRERVYLHDRLNGDRQRLLEKLEQRAAALSVQTREALVDFVEKAWDQTRDDLDLGEVEAKIRHALSEELCRTLERAAADLLELAGERFHALQDGYCRDMEALIDRVRSTAADLFEVSCLEGIVLERLDVVREPSFTGHRWVTSFTEQAVLSLSRFLPARVRARRMRRRLHEDVGYLVARNIGELRWTTGQNLDEAFRRFETRLETQLTSVIDSIRSSIRTTWNLQEQRESRQVPELSRLQHHRKRLEQAWTMFSSEDVSTLDGGPV
jgi:GTPase SAR1 family protein